MPDSPSNTDEEQIDQLERSFPSASGIAFSQAYEKAIQAGLSVLVSENGAIFEVFPDGQRKLIKNIAQPSMTHPGQKIRFQ